MPPNPHHLHLAIPLCDSGKKQSEQHSPPTSCVRHPAIKRKKRVPKKSPPFPCLRRIPGVRLAVPGLQAGEAHRCAFSSHPLVAVAIDQAFPSSLSPLSVGTLTPSGCVRPPWFRTYGTSIRGGTLPFVDSGDVGDLLSTRRLMTYRGRAGG